MHIKYTFQWSIKGAHLSKWRWMCLAHLDAVVKTGSISVVVEEKQKSLELFHQALPIPNMDRAMCEVCVCKNYCPFLWFICKSFAHKNVIDVLENDAGNNSDDWKKMKFWMIGMEELFDIQAPSACCFVFNFPDNFTISQRGNSGCVFHI